jgi:imidazoleglycerol phosphate dehydratase HisB
MRIVELSRETTETQISLRLNLDGRGTSEVDTGIGFLDHMVTALCRHARWDLTLKARGDLHVDDHHTVEDCALLLGEAVDHALGTREGICRFGTAFAPMDGSLARAVVDLSGRPAAVVDLGMTRECLGALATENLTHFFVSFAMKIRGAIHLDLLRGDNDHHRAEAAFKALALALRVAIATDGTDQIPSTKGVL